MSIKHGLVLILLAVVAGLAALPAPARADDLTIYSSLPLNTPERAIYEDIVRGERPALEQAGRMAGPHTVRLVSLNDASDRGGWDPGLTARNARRAAQDESTIAYLGEFNSGATAISLPILNEAGILQVSPTNSYVGLTRSEGAEPGEPVKYYPTGLRTFGRVSPADHLQAAALAELLERDNVDRVFLVDDTEVYGAGLRKMLERRLNRRGITISGRGELRRKRVSERMLRRLARSRAEAIVFTGTTRSSPHATAARRASTRSSVTRRCESCSTASRRRAPACCYASASSRRSSRSATATRCWAAIRSTRRATAP